MSDSLRVLLADDHPVFRDGLSSLLRSLDDVELVAEASTGAEAVALSEQHQPDVIVMDLHMPDLNGIDATREVVRAQRASAYWF